MEQFQLIWILLQVAFVGFLVILNGFFVAAEFALVKIRDSQLKPLINEGNPQAIMTGKVLDNLDTSLSACQLGITLASLALGWVGEPVFAALLEPVMHAMAIESEKVQHMMAFLFGFSAITFLHITAGEQAPKLMAIQKPLPTSLWVAKPLWLFCKISYPFIWALNKASNRMLHWVGIEPVSEHELLHSEEELQMLISDTHHHQGGTNLEKEIVFNAMELRQRLVREVMQPRTEIILLSTDMSLEECLTITEKERYSRYPLCDESDPDKVIGVVHFKELYSLRHRLDGGLDLAGPESLPRAELYRRAAAVIGRTTRVRSIPMFLGYTMAWFLELFMSAPPVTRAMLGVLDHDDDIDVTKALRILELDKLTELDAMLRKTVAKS